MPPADERPGNMSTNDYLGTLAPKLLAMQELRQHPFAPRSSQEYQAQDSMSVQEPPRMQGVYRLRKLLATEWDPRQRLELETALNKLLGVSITRPFQNGDHHGWHGACIRSMVPPTRSPC